MITKKMIMLLLTLSMALRVSSQIVTVYIVDKDDLSEVKYLYVTQKELNTEYKTLVMVNDSHKEEFIGGWGSYKDVDFSNIKLKSIVNDAIKDNMSTGNCMIRCNELPPTKSPFDGILGLRWGMLLKDALSELDKIGLSSWINVTDNEIMAIHKTVWDGIAYDVVRLEFLTSNKQISYLNGIIFLKLCDDANTAKKYRENIVAILKIKYGTESVTEKIGDNGFKRYDVWSIESFGKITRINLYINRASNNEYGVVLSYNGVFEAANKVNFDNQ